MIRTTELLMEGRAEPNVSKEAPAILALATATPPHRWEQESIRRTLAESFSIYDEALPRRMFDQAGIDHRHFVIGPSEFDPKSDADALHQHFRKHAVELAKHSVRQCLESGQLGAVDIDYLVVATCTGYMCPGLTAHLARDLGFRDDLQRADLVGMGCSGAMPALQRAHDFALAYPGKRALVVMVEISSSCFYVDDTMDTVVGNVICGDGAAAAVVGMGGNAQGPRLARFSTLMDTSFIDSVGFEFKAGKNRIILAKELRSASGPLVEKAVERLLGQAGLAREHIDHWVVHSGGRRILEGIDESLGFANGELDISREVLRQCGNMSSATLCFVLEQTNRRAKPGDLGVLIALGPGLAAETAIVQW